jgi:UDP-sulfoquinovose synthase
MIGSKMKNVIVFGGDGFLGWPLSLRLKASGYNVLIVDNYSRRWYDKLLGMNSLVPISTPDARSQASGIPFVELSIDRDFHKLVQVFEKFNPDAIVHFAQQRSAPISMHSSSSRVSTITNNNASTISLLEAVRNTNPTIKILHMGTMGVYGYESSSILSEGYVNDSHLAPMNPGSVYHLSKCQDQLTFQLYQKLYGLDIVDLHQGVVWGSQTTETLASPELFNRYDYDSMYGTVVNRFIAQYAKKMPLTVYGNGLQKRAFIHINDSIASCVNALILPPSMKVNIANQFSELLTVNQVAERVLSLNTVKEHPGILQVENPRIETSADFDAKNDHWKTILASEPMIMSKKILKQELQHIKPYVNRYDPSQTMPYAKW